MRFEVLMQVSDKPPEVRVNSLLTPRSISQRSKIRMHARRYHPKKDSPKVILEYVTFLPASFFLFFSFFLFYMKIVILFFLKSHFLHFPFTF